MDVTHEFIEEIEKGNNTIFTEILNNFYKEIYAYTYRQVEDMEDAKDLTQDIFIKVYKNIKKYNPSKSSFRTWIYRVATNYCLDYYKSKYYKNKINGIRLEIDVEKEEDLLEQVISEERIEYIIKLMNEELHSKHKRIMYLHFFAELSVKEIAETLNIPIKTVYSSIDISLKKLRKQLEGKYYD